MERNVTIKLDTIAGPGSGVAFSNLTKGAKGFQTSVSTAAMEARQGLGRFNEGVMKTASGLALLGRTGSTELTKVSAGLMELGAGVNVVIGLGTVAGQATVAMGKYAAAVTSAVIANRALAASSSAAAAATSAQAAVGAGGLAKGIMGGAAPAAGGAAAGLGAGAIGGGGGAAAIGGAGLGIGATAAVVAVVAAAGTLIFDHLANRKSLWSTLGEGFLGWDARSSERIESDKRYDDREKGMAAALAIRVPAEERMRALRDTGSSLRSQQFTDGRIYRAGRQIEADQLASAMAFAPTRRVGETSDQLGARREQYEDAARGVALTTSKALAQAQMEIVEAEREHGRAIMDVADVQKELNRWAKDNNRSAVEGLSLHNQMRSATDRLLDAEKKRLEAIRMQGKVSVENLTTWKQFAAEQEKSAKAFALAEKERQKDMKQQFAELDPVNRQTQINVADLLRRGVKLTKGQAEFAKNSPFLQEMFQQDSLKRLGPQGEAQFGRLMELTGRSQALRDAEKTAKMFGDVKVEMQTRIDAQINLNEQALGKQLQEQLLPRIMEAIQRTKDAMQQEFEKRNREDAANRRGNAAGG